MKIISSEAIAQVSGGCGNPYHTAEIVKAVVYNTVAFVMNDYAIYLVDGSLDIAISMPGRRSFKVGFAILSVIDTAITYSPFLTFPYLHSSLDSLLDDIPVDQLMGGG